MIDVSNLTNIFSTWIVSLNELWTLLNSSLTEVLSNSNIFSDQILNFILTVAGLGKYTILEIMLGVGLTLYLVYQLLIWALNLIT